MQAAHPNCSSGTGPTYGGYLHLDPLLRLQTPLSDSHDETLFIVIHQASELWLKLCIHELEAARSAVRDDELRPALKMLARVISAQSVLTASWQVLQTMTPSDYMSFRESLGTSSGFQSHQYRLLEFLLGNKSRAHVERHVDDPATHVCLAAALETPSLYDETLRLLARRGFDIPESCLQRDFSEPYRTAPGVEAAWAAVYRNVDQHWDLYEFAEKLVDLEERMQQWRFGHLRTVERIIGRKPGTGGTPGVPYLAAVLNQRFFPELFSLRTVL